MQGSSFQSTHPVWGATRKGEDVAVLHDKFQSTHPVWGATSQKESGKGLFGFQSTHPVWGATTTSVTIVLTLIFQSTHPVWGATLVRTPFCTSFSNFNPRTPCGVRLGDFKGYYTAQNISIHAPRVGCDINLW